MAAETGRKTTDIRERICREPERFTLSQILRIIALHNRNTTNAAEETAHLRPWLSLAFPASEVASADRTEPDSSGGAAWNIEATDFGLYSTLGPLPTFYTEELLEEARQDSSISREFLDIVNDRLFKLRNAANLHNKLGRRAMESGEQAAREALFAFMGQPSAAFRPEAVPQTAQMPFLADHRRTAEGLVQFLQTYLGVDTVTVEQCVPCDIAIRPGQRCRPGMQCATLGSDAVLGRQVRDITCKIRIHLHDLTGELLQSFLPGGSGHAHLAQGIRLYMDTPLLFDLVLHPAATLKSCQRLGDSARCGAYLGEMRHAAPVCIPFPPSQEAGI